MTAQNAEAPAVAAPVAEQSPAEEVAAVAPGTAEPAPTEQPAGEKPEEAKTAEKKPEEAKPEEKKPEDKQAAKIAKAFGELGRKEKRLVEQQQKFSADREAFAKQRAEMEQFYEQIKKVAEKADSFEQRLAEGRRNPLKFMEEVLGKNYEDISQFVLNEGKLTPEQEQKLAIEEAKAEAKRAASELEKFKAEQKRQAEEWKRRRAEQATQDVEKAKAAFYDEGVAFVKNNVSDYELILQNGAEEEVPKLVELTYAQTKKVISLKEAADQIEDVLIRRLERVTSSQKWARLQAEKQAKSKPTTPAPVPTKPSPTIDNSMAAPSTKPSPKVTKKESEEEYTARVLAEFRKAHPGGL